MNAERRIVVFAGPTIGTDEARSLIPEVDIRAPAMAGDILRAVGGAPIAIALIDGFFESVPAPWHKELLYALSRGVHVFGAASLGALRAAELECFGVRGVGQVFEWFVSGELEADDEVAVAHGLAEHSFRAFSVALVDMRVTLDAAVKDEVISEALRSDLVACAKRLPYRERSYAAVLVQPEANRDQQSELRELAAWLPHGTRSIKHEDALELFSVLQDLVLNPPPPFVAEFELSRTRQFVEFYRSEQGASTGRRQADVLEELLLEPERYVAVWNSTFRRILADIWAKGSNYEPSADDVAAVAADLIRRQGVPSFEAWSAAQDLNLHDARIVLSEEASAQWAARHLAPVVEGKLIDSLRVDGYYNTLSQRAGAKSAVLADVSGLDGEPSVELTSDTDLLTWFFQTKCHVPVPDDVEEWAALFGFTSTTNLLRVLRREQFFLNRHGAEANADDFRDETRFRGSVDRSP